MRGLRDVAEVRGQDGIERLCYQPLHVAETLHDRGRFLVVDMQDQRERQTRLVPSAVIRSMLVRPSS